MTATATGTLGTTAFTGAAITVTSVADTSGAFVASGTTPDLNWENIASSSTITIAGIGTETFTDQTFWVDPNGAGDIIFGDVDGGAFFGGILGLTQLFVGLQTYNLQSAFGPVSSPFRLRDRCVQRLPEHQYQRRPPESGGNQRHVYRHHPGARVFLVRGVGVGGLAGPPPRLSMTNWVNKICSISGSGVR